MNKENIIIGFLGIMAIGTISLEILVSDQNVTKTESTLFGILQFVFSIAFAWYLSKNNSKAEFEDQQKKFAVAAFRRIKEIESQTSHLVERLNRGISDRNSNGLHELDIARTVALAIHETTQSSKLDWADVIGEQIEALDKIQSIKRQKAMIKESDFNIVPDSESTKTPEINTLEEEINSLKNSLSSELKLLSDSEEESTRKQLQREMLENGFLELTGFGGGKDDFLTERDIDTLEIGDVLDVSIEDVGDRTATLLARDNKGQLVGSFLNLYNGTYADFTHEVCDALETSSFHVKVSKHDGKDENTGRKYFKVITTKA